MLGDLVAGLEAALVLAPSSDSEYQLDVPSGSRSRDTRGSRRGVAAAFLLLAFDFLLRVILVTGLDSFTLVKNF